MVCLRTAQRQSALEGIHDSSLDDATESLPARPESYPAVGGVEKRVRDRQRKKLQLEKAYTIDNADETGVVLETLMNQLNM